MAKSEFVSGMGIGFQILKVLNEAVKSAGGKEADLRQIETDAKLRREIAKLVVSGGKSVTDYVIDCDVDPFVPGGWQVEEHKKGGHMKWDPARITLHLSDNQKGDRCIEGNKLRKELGALPVLNANVLDYLLKHTELIPEAWKKDERGNMRYIFFWGTIYRYSDGHLCVRYLCWGGDRWSWYYCWLDSGWFRYDPAALLQV